MALNLKFHILEWSGFVLIAFSARLCSRFSAGFATELWRKPKRLPFISLSRRGLRSKASVLISPLRGGSSWWSSWRLGVGSSTLARTSRPLSSTCCTGVLLFYFLKYTFTAALLMLFISINLEKHITFSKKIKIFSILRALWSWKVRLKTGFDAHFRMWKNTAESGSDTQFLNEFTIQVICSNLSTVWV